MIFYGSQNEGGGIKGISQTNSHPVETANF